MQLKKRNRKNGGYKLAMQAEWYRFYLRVFGEGKAADYIYKLQKENNQIE